MSRHCIVEEGNFLSVFALDLDLRKRLEKDWKSRKVAVREMQIKVDWSSASSSSYPDSHVVNRCVCRDIAESYCDGERLAEVDGAEILSAANPKLGFLLVV